MNHKKKPIDPKVRLAARLRLHKAAKVLMPPKQKGK